MEVVAGKRATIMDMQFGLLQSLWNDKDELPFLEDIMEFPPCPVCKEGHLLPFSDEKTPFSFWVCSKPNCGYAIGRKMTEQTYYKGTAASEEKEKGSKRWTKYDF
jgi:hypothetical protein